MAIADGEHVHPALWPIITRTKPADRLMLVSDAISLAGTGEGRGWIGGLEVEVVGRRVSLAGGPAETLAQLPFAGALAVGPSTIVVVSGTTCLTVIPR